MSTFPLNFHPSSAAKAPSVPVAGLPKAQGLYTPANEHDACGVGFVAHIKGQKSHKIVQQGLQILANLTHRGATGYDPKLGDGAGMLIQMPDAFMRKEAAKLNINSQLLANMLAVPRSYLKLKTVKKLASRLLLASFTKKTKYC